MRFWQNYFDCGEYMFARYADSLQLDCDCLGDIHYLDAVVADDLGNPRTISNAICLHEEDHGVLWKHTDIFTGAREVRRQRRLVISFFTPIGNYDYGFYWYLYLDGTIELECKATGIVFTSGTPGEYATEVAPGLGAPFHQHLFSARLDMTVNGTANAVEEGRDGPCADGRGQPPRQRIRPIGDPADLGVPRPAGRRPGVGTGLARRQHREDQRAGTPGRLRPAPARTAHPAGGPGVVDPRAGDVRLEGAVGDPLRPGAALPGR